MGNKNFKMKKYICMLIALVMIVPLLLSGASALPGEGLVVALGSVLNAEAKDNFEAWYKSAVKGYNDNVTEIKESESFYSYYDGNNTNPAFTVGTGASAKNMTSLYEMKNGESLYALIGSNAYMESRGTNNAIGYFLKSVGYSRTAGDNTTPALVPMTEAHYVDNDISNFVWRIEKVGSVSKTVGGEVVVDHYFQISAFEINAENTTKGDWASGMPRATLTSNSGVKVWPSGVINKTTDCTDQQWILTEVVQNNERKYVLADTNYPGYRDWAKQVEIVDDRGNVRRRWVYDNDCYNIYDKSANSDNLYAIRNAATGKYLNTQVTNTAGAARVWLGDQQTGVQIGTSGNWKITETSHRWSEWLVLPILQDFDSSVTYGYTKTNGNGIQSTISSLSKINPHNTDTRKQRDEYGHVITKNGVQQTWDTIDYGKGNMNYETVFGNNITYSVGENTLNTSLNMRNANGSFAECVGALRDDGAVDYTGRSRIQFPVADPLGTVVEYANGVGSELVQYMNLQCGDFSAGKNRLLWTISPQGYNRYLTANRAFNDVSELGEGNKPYPTWSEYTSKRDGDSGYSDIGAYQHYFIIYSLNQDGGFYFSPVCHSYISEERENFRVLDIAAYTGEILQLWDYNYGSNSRFWLNFYESDKLETKVVDVLISLGKNGKVENVERAYPYYNYSSNSTSVKPYGKSGNTLFELYDERGKVVTSLYEADGKLRKEFFDSNGNPVSVLYDSGGKQITTERIQEVYYNAAFYDESDLTFSTTQYQDRGFFYALDTAKNATVNNTVCYRLFYKYISDGQSVIVKNADSIDTSENYAVSDLNGGDSHISLTYAKTKGTYATYRIDIAKNLTGIFTAWYVSESPSLKGSRLIGSSGTNIKFEGFQKADKKVGAFDASVTYESDDNKHYTELKIENPTKENNGLYFFCVVVRNRNAISAGWPNEWDPTSSDLDALYNFKFTQSNFCRLDVANNVIYHNVDANGNETGKIGEDWLLYGTNTKVKEEFETNGGYIKYDLTDEGNIPDSLLEENYSLLNSETGKWMLFDDTIKNPNKSTELSSYQFVYKEYYSEINSNDSNNGKYVDVGEDGHSYWKFNGGFKFTMDGNRASILHDTSINLYVLREGASSTEELEAWIFVDKFGTSFVANGTADGKIVGASKEGNGENKGENKFLSDVFLAVAISSGNAPSINAEDIEYYDYTNNKWVKLKGSSIEYSSATKDTAKKWYSEWSENLSSWNYVFALKLDFDSVVKTFNAQNETGGISKNIVLSIRCSSSASGGDDWFNQGINSVCGTIVFVPFDYNALT